MEEKLTKLYALQKVDSSLDELEEMKGDLPVAVAHLEAQVSEQQNQIYQLEEMIRQAIIDRDKADLETISQMEKIEKYKAQQYEVKSNRQYDALSREIDSAQEKITQLEKEIEALEGKVSVAREDLEKAKAQLMETLKELKEKKQELEEVSKANEDEDLRMKHEREKLVVRIDRSDLTLYERIRKAKGGIAVVPVKRNACAGCYNAVPPQKVLELRKNNRVYTCEHCGRILVSDEIVEKSSTWP
ncbi:MAG: C4-type zinc ribbon domain-containing protein [Bacteroidota bacterium]